MSKITEEFKEFIMRGNVMDMAVGVIVGGAFSNIINSLVNDVLMPVISIATGKVTFPIFSSPGRPVLPHPGGSEGIDFRFRLRLLYPDRDPVSDHCLLYFYGSKRYQCDPPPEAGTGNSTYHQSMSLL